MEEEVRRAIKEITGENAELETELRNGIYVRGSEGTDMGHFSLQVPSKDYGRVMILTVSSVNAITEEDKDFLSAVVSQMGIAFERSENFSRVERIARYDDLTGVFRRRFFFELMEDEFRRGRVLSLLLFDVDKFSQVNNSYGHHKGDECLAKFAEVLKRNVRTKVRKVDHVGRYGGDEFVMLIDGLIDEGVIAGERVREQIESSPVLRECDVTTSVGVW